MVVRVQASVTFMFMMFFYAGVARFCLVLVHGVFWIFGVCTNKVVEPIIDISGFAAQSG